MEQARTETGAMTTPGRAAPPEQTAWMGWLLFAGCVLVLLGAYHVIAGLVALFRRNVYLVEPDGMVLAVNYTGWGWIHLIGGIVVAAIGFGVLQGATWARMGGIAIAGLSALINLAFLPAYPLWSALMIALDVVVIYALAVHGRELQRAR